MIRSEALMPPHLVLLVGSGSPAGHVIKRAFTEAERLDLSVLALHVHDPGTRYSRCATEVHDRLVMSALFAGSASRLATRCTIGDRTQVLVDASQEAKELVLGSGDMPADSPLWTIEIGCPLLVVSEDESPRREGVLLLDETADANRRTEAQAIADRLDEPLTVLPDPTSPAADAASRSTVASLRLTSRDTPCTGPRTT